MTVIELYRYLDEHIPSSLSCEWDNDGLMCCPDGAAEVKRVLVTLDVTSDAIETAKKEGCEAIVSHHPLIFRGVKSVNCGEVVPSRVIELIKNNITAMSFHTRLDAVSGGVNDLLAIRLGIKEAEPFGECGIGRIGTLENPMPLDDFARLVKQSLGAPTVQYADAGKEVYKVAVLGGSGGDDVPAALALGADTYVSGEFSYHALADAPEGDMNLIEAGHFYTEEPVCEALADLVSSADSSIKIIKHL